MADSQIITISLRLPCDEAAALARLTGRLGSEHYARFTAPCTAYGDRPEANVMQSTVSTLQGALAALAM